MENASLDAVIAEQDKSSGQIEQDMEQTRESITEKVAALENKVLGTAQSATDMVVGTVDAVKEAVATTPAAIRDSLREIVDVVKETVGSFSAIECMRTYPVAALGVSTIAGFLTGYLLGNSRARAPSDQPIVSREPTPSSQASIPPSSDGPRGGMFDWVGSDVRRFVGDAMSTGIAGLRRGIDKVLPVVVDRVIDRMNGSSHSSAETKLDSVRDSARVS